MINKIMQEHVKLEDLRQMLFVNDDVGMTDFVIDRSSGIISTIKIAHPSEPDEYRDAYIGSCLWIYMNDIQEKWDLSIGSEYLESPEKTFGVLLDELNRMIDANNLIKIRLSPEIVCDIYNTQYLTDFTPENIDITAAEFIKKIDRLNLIEEKYPFSEALYPVWSTFYLELPESEQAKLETLTTVTEGIAFLDTKMAQRKRNDCLVKYANTWSQNLRDESRALLSQFSDYPAGLPMKHIMRKTGKIAYNGTIITDEGTTKVIPDKGHYCIGFNNLTLGQEYASLEAMIDDGWAVD